MTDDIGRRLARIRDRMDGATRRVGRTDRVTLVAVSKTVSLEQIAAAHAAGQRVFGENRVQEGLQHIQELTGNGGRGSEWHLIGHLQTNKVRPAAEAFACIQSVDSLKLARKLDVQLEKLGRTLPVLLEVNVAGEESKSGFEVEDLIQSFSLITALQAIRIRGLMTIAPLADDPEDVRPVFRRLRGLRDELRGQGSGIDLAELSMGMTGDFEVAIEEGATMVRIGRLLFGERTPNRGAL